MIRIHTKPLDEKFRFMELPLLGQSIKQEECMELATLIALRGMKGASPNPLVGTVAVDSEHRFIHAAAHQVYGQSHAEVLLMEGIKAKKLEHLLKNATIYVTLEPCSHFGKTPPCAHLLGKYPLKEVIFACIDPNPLVQSKGQIYLQDKGIACTHSQVFEEIAKPINAIFCYSIKTGLPFVGVKIASSLDGCYAFHDKARSPQITSTRAREYGHFLRYFYDAILVGSNTMVLDRPMLNVRHPFFPEALPPVKIVIDRNGKALNPGEPKIPFNPFFVSAPSTLWCMLEETWHKSEFAKLRPGLEEQGVVCVSLLSPDDPKSWLRQIQEIVPIRSLLVEGGASMWGTFIENRCVQKIHHFQAPTLVSPKQGNMWNQGFKLSEDLSLMDSSITLLDENFVFEASTN